MKKVLSIILILATLLTLFCSCSERVRTSGDYEYVVLEDDTAKITKYIGTQAVTELDIPSSLEEYTVTVIGKEAFKGAANLTVVNTPETLTKVEEYAFANSSVKKVFMHRSKLITEIGAYAFSECKNLIQVDMPMSLESLGEYAFFSCEKLKTAQFRGNTQKIGDFVFDACPKVVIRCKSNALNVQNYANKYHLETKISDPVPVSVN